MDEIEQSFELHCVELNLDGKLKRFVTLEKFYSALKACGANRSPKDAAVLFRSMDVDENGGLDLQEFKRAVATPTKLEQWIESLPIPRLLARCLTSIGEEVEDPVREFCQLRDENLNEAVTAFGFGLRSTLAKYQSQLQLSYEEMERKARDGERGVFSKFQISKLNCGGIEDFHRGLEGPPNPDLPNGIQIEHCSKAGCQDDFITPNYGLTTNTRKEFEIASGLRVCDQKDLNDRNGRRVRYIRKIDDLKASKEALKAGLTEHEIIAMVLYTGPMYYIYNAVLRRAPEHIYAKFRDVGNMFPTTIHVLVSAVVKLARGARLPVGLELFRGLGGQAELPESFLSPDENGCLGFMEWGFMSTTSDKDIAVQYSGVAEGKPLSIVLSTCVGSIDRGACITTFSQYPAELEYLWVPCSFVEPAGPPKVEFVRAEPVGGKVVGLVTIVPVRVNANLRALTVEELLGQKRSMHLTAFRFMLDEVARDLGTLARTGKAELRLASDWSRVWGGIEYTVTGFLDRIEAECREVLARHEQVPCSQYIVDEAYQALVVEMLRTKASALCKLRLYLEDQTLGIEHLQKMSLRDARSNYLALLERALPPMGASAREGAAQRLCRFMGLMHAASVDALDANALTRLMAAAADGEGPKALRCLVAAGADVNLADRRRGQTALHLAACYGNTDEASALLALGADINAAALDGSTPLFLAALGGHLAAVELLRQNDADIHAPDRDGRTPMYAAVQGGRLAMMEALQRMGSDVNAATKDGRSPLWAAAFKGHLDVVLALHALRADIDQRTNDGRTPLFVAASNGHLAVVETLCRLGADPLLSSQGGITPESAAARSGHIACAASLHTAVATLAKSMHQDTQAVLGQDVSHIAVTGAAPLQLQVGALVGVPRSSGAFTLGRVLSPDHFTPPGCVRVQLDATGSLKTVSLAALRGVTPVLSGLR